MASKEHPFRQLLDQIAVLGIDNKNLQTIIDTKVPLRNAKALMETKAVRIVNIDHKDQFNKIDINILEENIKKNNAKRILDEIVIQHRDAEKNFEKLLKEAENRRSKASLKLNELKKNLVEKRTENQMVQSKVDDTEKNISKFREEITQLNKDINSLKETSETSIAHLEKERKVNIGIINDLRAKLSDADHDYSNLKILIAKTRSEIQYLNSEKCKHQSQDYQKRIDGFLKSITDSGNKSQGLSEELFRLNSEWQEKLFRTKRETEMIVKNNEHEDCIKKSQALLSLLEKKNSELVDLKNRKIELESQFSSESSNSKDERFKFLRVEVDKTNKNI